VILRITYASGNQEDIDPADFSEIEKAQLLEKIRAEATCVLVLEEE